MNQLDKVISKHRKRGCGTKNGQVTMTVTENWVMHCISDSQSTVQEPWEIPEATSSGPRVQTVMTILLICYWLLFFHCHSLSSV
jgi:hypothetical protein